MSRLLDFIPVVSNKKTAENIRSLMKEKGYRYHDLKEACSLESHMSVYKWMNGQSIPSVDNLIVLGALFNVPIDVIVGVDYISAQKGETCT